ncbi:hypothetical protein Tco_0128815 [Tanacetum coccineum]
MWEPRPKPLYSRSTVASTVQWFVDEEDVSTRAVDEEDVRPRVVLDKIIKAQKQKIVDMQHRLLLLEQIMNTQNTRPSDVDHSVDHLDMVSNVLVGGLDHQSMEGVSQCMNVVHLDKVCQKGQRLHSTPLRRISSPKFN